MASESPRPLLLPQNRKLRHLQGIYVRNLTLSRSRGQAADDATLNKSPQKLAALRGPQLQHARSSGDLRPAQSRSRSANWVGAPPSFRQKKLEDVLESRMADTFFTLHCRGREEPIYISEVVGKAMNPSFRFFDLSCFGPATTRRDSVTVKVWVKRKDWKPLLEEEVNLQALQFVGTLKGHPFPPNCILFHLIDGIYTVDLASKPPRAKHAPSLPTASYSALMRLSTLDDTIQDALATREELACQINAILQSEPPDEAPPAQEELALATRYVAAEKKRLKSSVRRRAELLASISARGDAITSGKERQARALADIHHAQDTLSSCRALLATAAAGIAGQRRRICEELMGIFPIEPTTQPLLFTICGLPLPNSPFEDADEDVASAALGYVARVVDMLQYYLSIPLPYPVSALGSRSIVQDSISILADNQRTFPLYLRGTVRFRFDYGVFLLNKNIEALAESQGLKVMDIRQTLPNLKSLLCVCSAGRSEPPARKAGGIRGLLTAQRGMVTSSRKGSADSSLGGGPGEARRGALEAGGADAEGPPARKAGNGAAPPVRGRTGPAPTDEWLAGRAAGGDVSLLCRSVPDADSPE
ncbi:hypothetical protein PZA11_004476 [Diplocarpon coronariae]|uniref:Autophagy-related protein 14 n=1 Tax=Diplocarpon coronariae TaxID=2795749 RepID=A0A218ZC50_9HELO|nr:UV radiation resistance protein (UVRAG) [Marssonina coronariae]